MSRFRFGVALSSSLLCAPALASFHLMQIYQVMAGVNGNTHAQAIQLRMRFSGQSFLTGTTLQVFDANGLNPITLVTFDHSVGTGLSNTNILIATADFVNATNPHAVVDFTMTNRIPDSYLAAGRLNFTAFGVTYWSICWGGNAYTGPKTFSTTNDADGNSGPAFAGPLPSTTTKSLQFKNSSSASSTTTLADYDLTLGSAVFTNNAGTTFTVRAACPADLNGDGLVDDSDFVIFVAAYNDLLCPDAPAACPADLNKDTVVDDGDFVIFVAAYNELLCP